MTLSTFSDSSMLVSSTNCSCENALKEAHYSLGYSANADGSFVADSVIVNFILYDRVTLPYQYCADVPYSVTRNVSTTLLTNETIHLNNSQSSNSTGTNGTSTGVNGTSTGVNGTITGVNGTITGVNGTTTGVNGTSTGTNGTSTGVNGTNGTSSGVNGTNVTGGNVTQAPTFIVVFTNVTTYSTITENLILKVTAPYLIDQAFSFDF
jgi:hypothetical protein